MKEESDGRMDLWLESLSESLLEVSYSLLKENSARFFFGYFSRVKNSRRLWYKPTGGRLAHSESNSTLIS